MAEMTRDEFREGLWEALTVIKKLSPHCSDFDEMVGLIELATGSQQGERGNDAQLKILMALVLPQQQPQGNRRT